MLRLGGSDDIHLAAGTLMVEPYRPFVPVHFPATTEDKNIDVIATFHYVVGGVIALFSSMFMIHILLGIGMLMSPDRLPMGPAPGAHPHGPIVDNQKVGPCSDAPAQVRVWARRYERRTGV